MKKYIIKFTPTAETIKNKYKNFKATYEVLPELTTSSGQMKSNSTGIVSNAFGCVEIAYDIPCEYGNIHPEGNGPGNWCDGTGSHTQKIQVGDCSGGSSGQSGGNSNSGNNVLVPPTFYANNIVQCDDTNADNFIYNEYSNHQNLAYNNLNDFNLIVGGLCGDLSEEKKDLVQETLNSMETTPPFVWTYEGDDGTSFNDPNPSLEPILDFDPLDNYETKFPRFTSIVKNLKTFVKNNPKVLKALQKWSGFTKQQILEKLVFKQGNGPIIKIKQLPGVYGHYNHKLSPGILEIDEAVVSGLEISFLQSTQEGTAFLLAATILHEFVHFGENSNGLTNTGQVEFGTEFEKMAFGVTITTANAVRVSILFNKKK